MERTAGVTSSAREPEYGAIPERAARVCSVKQWTEQYASRIHDPTAVAHMLDVLSC